MTLTLDDWKKKAAGWPVASVLFNTDGVTTVHHVIYNAPSPPPSTSPGSVQLCVSGGTPFDWGTVPSGGPTEVVQGTTVKSSLPFEITCTGGTLTGNLGTSLTGNLGTSFAAAWGDHGHHEEDDPVPPGSWTASDGSGQHYHRRERRDEEGLELVGSHPEREALPV